MAQKQRTEDRVLIDRTLRESMDQEKIRHRARWETEYLDTDMMDVCLILSGLIVAGSYIVFLVSAIRLLQG